MRYALFALAVLAALATEGRADPIYFVVAEWPGQATHLDSYVLPLTDSWDIAHARQLIAEGPATGLTIAVARIEAGADGVNRDHLAPGAPAWSWHVAGFRGFADFTAELYDGSPGLVERDVAGWLANTGGTIGFWNYTVVAELHAAPEPGALALLGSGALGLLGSARLRRRVWGAAVPPLPILTGKKRPPDTTSGVGDFSTGCRKE